MLIHSPGHKHSELPGVWSSYGYRLQMELLQPTSQRSRTAPLAMSISITKSRLGGKVKLLIVHSAIYESQG
jgi:hypothetical protein